MKDLKANIQNMVDQYFVDGDLPVVWHPEWWMAEHSIVESLWEDESGEFDDFTDIPTDFSEKIIDIIDQSVPWCE